MTTQQKSRGLQVLELLQKRYPTPRTNLVASNAWELLVATILSAQCTDERVNQVTPRLFARWPSPHDLALANQKELEEVIHELGFYHSKASHLIQCAKQVTDEFGGKVPQSIEELVRLKGVARKTANVVLSSAYGINEGLAVDTHVKRISTRLGLTTQQKPNEIERDLMEIFPRDEWGNVNHRMVWFGREVCSARRPRCGECEMLRFCPKCGVES